MIMMMIVPMAVVMMMAADFADLFFFHECMTQSALMLHRLHDHLSIQLIPRCADQRCFRVQRAEQCHACFHFLRRFSLRTAEDQRVCVFDLIIEEFAEVF